MSKSPQSITSFNYKLFSFLTQLAISGVFIFSENRSAGIHILFSFFVLHISCRLVRIDLLHCCKSATRNTMLAHYSSRIPRYFFFSSSSSSFIPYSIRSFTTTNYACVHARPADIRTRSHLLVRFFILFFFCFFFFLLFSLLPSIASFAFRARRIPTL